LPQRRRKFRPFARGATLAKLARRFEVMPQVSGSQAMKSAPISQIVFAAACLAALSMPLPAGAGAGTQPGQAPAAAPKNLECSGEAVTGSGPGFKSSQEESEQAARANWTEKARAVYPDADWAAAKEPFIQCVKQGLYSKCFATGVPCRPKPE